MNTVDPATQGLDGRALDSLRRDAARNPKAAIRQAAVQLESMFMQLVLKSMRDATPKTEPSPVGETFTGMLDAQFAKQFAGKSTGLADMIERQLSRQMQGLPAASPENVPSPVSFIPSVENSADRASTVSADRTGAQQAAFVQRMAPYAQRAEQESGIPAAYILGQAALESGWGKGEIRHADGSPSFNLFGIKATTGWSGPTATVLTTEFDAGQPVRQTARFRSYRNYEEAFSDYAKLLSGNSRYRAIVGNATTPSEFAGALQRAGYATDPQYADKLARTINHTLILQRAVS